LDIRKRKPLTQEFRVSIATSRCRLVLVALLLTVLGFLEVGRSATCEHGAFSVGTLPPPFVSTENPSDSDNSDNHRDDVLSKDIKRLTFKY
jgi:hypothetical protein